MFLGNVSVLKVYIEEDDTIKLTVCYAVFLSYQECPIAAYTASYTISYLKCPNICLYIKALTYRTLTFNVLSAPLPHPLRVVHTFSGQMGESSAWDICFSQLYFLRGGEGFIIFAIWFIYWSINPCIYFRLVLQDYIFADNYLFPTDFSLSGGRLLFCVPVIPPESVTWFGPTPLTF